jgi:predicted TIM-barrel fold metal-dependent hydrolase
MGVDRMMFSADYPFETMEDAATWFDKTPISEAQKMQVGRNNAVRLFKLDLKSG